MANSVIEQKPQYTTLPVGQEIIFVVSNETAVANELRLKFCVDVHISNQLAPVTDTTNHLVGTFKTTRNNAGVGIFDLRNVVENYVKADNMAANTSKYKNTETSDLNPHPIHLIDKYSLNKNILRYMALVFYVEFLDNNQFLSDGTTPNPNFNKVTRAVGTEQQSDLYTLFNGYLKHTDVLTKDGVDFGYDISAFNMSTSTNGRFLTNAPNTQYANLDDYGTVAFLQNTASLSLQVNSIKIIYYSSAGSPIGNETINKDGANGAYVPSAFFWLSFADRMLLYFGCFPANLRNTSTTFENLITAGTIQGGYYTIQTQDSTPTASSEIYTINLNCPNVKGFESIRLCWLNQWGAWDYYTFKMKSNRSITTSGTTYEQLGGTWNESTYRVDSYKGGKKAFRVNAVEKIIMNTDFVNENENVMFEELINSPEVYMLKGYQDITETDSVLNQYVTPVRLTTSTFSKKTVANDRLIQYTFEVEKSKTLRTQSV